MNPLRLKTATVLATLLATTLLICESAAALAPQGGRAKKNRKRPCAISGTVMTRDGELLVGTVVNVTAVQADFEIQQQTDENGQFSSTLPAPGKYRLRLEKSGYAPFEETLDFIEGEQQTITFRLLDEATGLRMAARSAYNEGVRAYQTDKGAAKERFLAATQLDPQLPEPHKVLADLYFSQEDYERAADHAERFLALQPRDQDVQVLALNAYLLLQRNPERVLELRRQLARDPEIAKKLGAQVFNEGVLATQRGHLDVAAGKFRLALEFHAGLVEARHALIKLSYNRQTFAETLDEVAKLLAQNPRDPVGLRFQFLTHEALDDRASSAAAFDALYDVDPQVAAQELYKVGELNFRNGEDDRALRAFLRVVEILPEFPQGHYSLGLCYATRDPAKARIHLMKFLELAPQHPNAATAREMLQYL